METHGEWRFGSLRLVMSDRYLYWYSGHYRNGSEGEVLSTDIALSDLVTKAKELTQEGSASFGLGGEDSAMIFLTQDRDTIRVSHMWDFGGYRSDIPKTTFYGSIVDVAKKLLAERDT